MLRRIIYISVYTGIGQFLSIFVLKYLSFHSPADQLKSIAAIDSLTFFIINVIAAGLQPAAIRNIALTNDWKPLYQETQSARITLGILMMVLGLLAFSDHHYFLFLIAPVLAWSGDYALYARGHSVKGAAIAFIRLLVPYATLFIAAFLKADHLAWIYVVALVITYVLTNLYISFFLGTPFVFPPQLKKLQLFVSSLPLGLVTLALYFIGLGVILVAPYFYDVPVVTLAFVGLKFYIIFKGVLRIILQAFVKEMSNPEVSLRVDQLSSLLGMAYVAFTLLFPDTIIRLFFGEKYIDNSAYFMILSLGGMVYALFNSLTTKALFEKKDIPFAVSSSIAAIVTIGLTILLSFWWQRATAIAVSILTGEVIFVTGMIVFIREKNIVWPRILFFIKNLVLLIIPVAIRLLMGDGMVMFLTAAVLFCMVAAIFHFKKFSLPATE